MYNFINAILKGVVNFSIKEFDRSFSDFLEREEYDKAANALFSITLMAFKAGWLAAGGTPLKPQKVVELVRPLYKLPPEDHPDYIETDITDDES